VLANAAKAIITSNNKAFYDIIDSATTGQIDSLPDSLAAHDFIIKSGKAKGLSNGLNLSGNFTWANTCSDSIFARMALHRWTFTGASPTLTLQGTGKRLLDSAQWVPQNSLSIVMDSNNTIKAFIPTRQAAAQTWVMQASRTLTELASTAYTWSGQGGVADTMRSSTSGGLARMALSAAKPCSTLYLKDMAFQGAAVTCTTGCYNGGNDSNVVWDTLKISAIAPTTISGLGGPCTLTVVHGRTAGGAVTVDGGAATLLSQGASQWRFTAPAHAAGTVVVSATSGLGGTPGTATINLTYSATCSTTTLIRAPTQTATVGVAITPMVHSWTGATPDSIKVRTALPTGLTAHPATGTISGTATDTTSMMGIMVVGYACSDSSVIYDSLRVGAVPVIVGVSRVDTIGQSGSWGHAVTWVPDSVVRIGTWPDSSALATGDTVAFHWLAKRAQAVYQWRAYGGGGSDTAWDTITIAGPTLAYAGNPLSVPVGSAITAQEPTSVLLTDSITGTVPHGLTLTKTGATMGRIAGTPDTIGTFRPWLTAWYANMKADSVQFTFNIRDTVAVPTASGGLPFRSAAYRTEYRGRAYRGSVFR